MRRDEKRREPSGESVGVGSWELGEVGLGWFVDVWAGVWGLGGGELGIGDGMVVNITVGVISICGGGVQEVKTAVPHNKMTNSQPQRFFLAPCTLRPALIPRLHNLRQHRQRNLFRCFCADVEANGAVNAIDLVVIVAVPA